MNKISQKAVVIETQTDIEKTNKAGDKIKLSLTKCVTQSCEIVKVWSRSNKLTANVGDRGDLILEKTNKTNENGEPYYNLFFVPEDSLAYLKLKYKADKTEALTH